MLFKGRLLLRVRHSFLLFPWGKKSIVNENVRYKQKIEVYLDGGPPPNAPISAAGLPAGLYVFQVTNPSGKVTEMHDE